MIKLSSVSKKFGTTAALHETSLYVSAGKTTVLIGPSGCGKKTPAQVLLAWAVQRGTALLTTPRTAARARENFNISALPQDALDEINRIQTRQRFNEVVKTGIPGFIPQGS
jgi:diketogulonate reductase-like aldo/keto reductase